MSIFSGAKKFLEDIGMGLIGGGLKQQPQNWQRRIGGGGVPTSPSSQMLRDISTVQQNQQYAQPMQKMPMATFAPPPQYEDSAFIGSPANMNQYSPISADVRNFIPSGYEDAAYMQSQGMLSPINSDIRNYQIPNFSGLQPTGQVVNWDSIPNNYTAGRTGYYQGSNPYLNDLDYYSQLRVR